MESYLNRYWIEPCNSSFVGTFFHSYFFRSLKAKQFKMQIDYDLQNGEIYNVRIFSSQRQQNRRLDSIFSNICSNSLRKDFKVLFRHEIACVISILLHLFSQENLRSLDSAQLRQMDKFSTWYTPNNLHIWTCNHNFLMFLKLQKYSRGRYCSFLLTQV